MNITPFISLRVLFLLGLGSLLHLPLFAQFPSEISDKINDYNQSKNKPIIDNSRDSLNPAIYYFHLASPTDQTLLTDTSLFNFHIYDPIRQDSYDYINTGNYGSAHRAIVYQPLFHKGFNAGFNNYDLYQFARKDIRYYQLERAYTDINFAQGASQEQTNFKGKFSKNIAPNVNLAIDYKRINDRGQYLNQQSRNTGFTVNTWYDSPSKRYRAFLSYTTNTIQQFENGGVNLRDTSGNFSKNILAIGRPINTTQAESRYFQRDLVFSHYYDINKATDSLTTLPIPTRKYTLFHQLSLKRNTYKYADALQATTTGYYENFLQDDRGIRHFIESRQYENTFSIRTYRPINDQLRYRKGANRKDGATATNDLIELGLTHIFTNLNQEPLDSTINNLFLFARLNYTPSKKLAIKTYAHFGALKQIGDYYIKGDFLWDIPVIGQVELGLIAQHYAPSLLQRRLIVTQQTIWNNNFSNTFENSLSASYLFPFLNIRVTGHIHRIKNHIYYNESAQATQASNNLNVLQLIIKAPIRWKGLVFENTFYLQNSDQVYFRLPSYYSIHRLSYSGYLFKKVLEYQVGSQVRINTPYFTDNFQPLIAQFFLQNQSERAFYPTIDAFINVKIKDFRFFINVQNIYDYFTPSFDFPVFSYPAFDSAVRFGFRWKFLDNNKGDGQSPANSGSNRSGSSRASGRPF